MSAGEEKQGVLGERRLMDRLQEAALESDQPLSTDVIDELLDVVPTQAGQGSR